MTKVVGLGPSREIRLPFPPSVNCLFAGKTRRYVSKPYARWRRAAGAELLAQRVRPVAGRVTIEILLTPPDSRRARDGDNYIKAINDLLVAHGIIMDDSAAFVGKTSAEWVESQTPGAMVIISSIP
jgi:Holliday junction resolvase RusA-like endonuclease